LAPDDAAPRPARVLLVEDDPHVQQLGQFILTDVGYAVDVAGTCQEARQLLEGNPPDVVLLDVHLPDGLGLDVLETLQANPATAGIPVIVVTGSMEAGAVRALDAGAHDFLPKPFEPTELVARVRAALRVKHARDELQQQARRDPLTGLPNRRSLDEALDAAIGHCRRRGEPISVALMDVINFKGVNDQHGHAVGDDVLVRIARSLQEAHRLGDIAGRWGGDEFLVVLPGADRDEAGRAVKRLKDAVAATVRLPGREIALRAGISTSEPRDTIAWDALVRAAAEDLREVHGQSG
jgi:diguanylate cyclase (GGDEF)-like protein